MSLRIGYDATTLDRHMSGVGYYAARLLEGLAAAPSLGEIVVLSNKPLAVPLPLETPGGPRIHVHEAGRFPIRSVWMQFRLPSILRATRPDVVHFTNYLAPLMTSAPYVVSVHDMSLSLLPECHTFKKRLLTASLIPAVARSARMVLTPSESTRRDVVRLLGLDPGRVRVIPYAPSPRFAPATSPASELQTRYGVAPPYFLYVGTLEPRKNLPRTLRAFARIASTLPEMRFVVVGQRGWKYEEVFREAARPELSGRTVFLDYVPEADLPLLYTHATAVVYASLYEGFGFPVVEAMACGAAVLTSTTSSLGEVAGDAAWLVDPLDQTAIADGLHRLATDGALRRDLGTRGRVRAATFTWERTARETVDAYHEARAMR